MRMIIPLSEDVDALPEGENLVRNAGGYGDIKAMREKKIVKLEVRDMVQGEQGCEHPVVNPRFAGKPYRY